MLQVFKIRYNEDLKLEDRKIIIKFKNEIEENLKRILRNLPESIIELQIPIYVFKNPNSARKYFDCFQNLEVINLCGIYEHWVP